MLKITERRRIFEEAGITYYPTPTQNPHVLTPDGVKRTLPLTKGDSKTLTYSFNILAGTHAYSFNWRGEHLDGRGTCVCDCEHCYAREGFYRMPSTLAPYAWHTDLARNHPDFLEKLIICQISAYEITRVRIHESGDFFSDQYINMWRNVVKSCPSCRFWSYTKNPEAEHAFDDLPNINIVKSVVEGIGFNFGHCDYVKAVYEILKRSKKSVYICKCGVDNSIHCRDCNKCIECEHVLFLEHSLAYDARTDPNYKEFAELVLNQDK